MPITLRSETPADAEAIARVHTQAFGQPDEARLVERLRAAGALMLSLVAVDATGEVVGHVALSPTRIAGHAPLTLGLGPMAVLPVHQRQGVGGALLRESLVCAKHRGACAVFVLGHPSYYPRFGFAPAHTRGLRCAFEVPREAFMARELQPDCLDALRGVVQYHEAFHKV